MTKKLYAVFGLEYSNQTKPCAGFGFVLTNETEPYAVFSFVLIEIEIDYTRVIKRLMPLNSA